jgi:hypothetical protein
MNTKNCKERETHREKTETKKKKGDTDERERYGNCNNGSK